MHKPFKSLPALLWLLALLATLPAAAQTLPAGNAPFGGTVGTNGIGTNPAVPAAAPDTSVVRKPTRKQRREEASADSARRTERLFGLRVTRPEKAGFLALAPGGGQIYNRRYWKLPIVYGLLGTLGYALVHEQSRFSEYKNAYAQLIVTRSADPSTLPADKYPNASKELSAANVNTGLIFYRGNRDLFVLLSAVGYSLQILDAVVDAHLHDFDVGDNLSLNCRPTLLPLPGQALPATGLALTLRVK